MEKVLITNVFLTKEDFQQHAFDEQEKLAKSYGMTLEQWRHAILTQQPICAPIMSRNLTLE